MVKIYGIAERLDPLKARLSDVINQCLVEAFQFPADKRAQRFFPMAKDDFYYPAGRSDAYTVLEFTILVGRTEASRKKLIQLLFQTLEKELGLSPVDVEIMIVEVPLCNYGFRGTTADESELSYRIDV